jgi:hypothetical protein
MRRSLFICVSCAGMGLATSACTQLLLGSENYILDESSAGGSSAGTGESGGSSVDPSPLVCEIGLTVCGSSCVELDSDPQNCGTCGHDCLGTACTAGTCEASTVSVDVGDLREIAVDDTHVYWTTGDGKVQRVLKGGGSVETLVDDQKSPGPIAVDATRAGQITGTGT